MARGLTPVLIFLMLANVPACRASQESALTVDSQSNVPDTSGLDNARPSEEANDGAYSDATEAEMAFYQEAYAPIDGDQWDRIRNSKDRRSFFRHNPILDRAYVHGCYRLARHSHTDPGNIYLLPMGTPGTLIGAACQAGETDFSPNLTGAERQEITDWKQRYNEIHSWPESERDRYIRQYFDVLRAQQLSPALR